MCAHALKLVSVLFSLHMRWHIYAFRIGSVLEMFLVDLAADCIAVVKSFDCIRSSLSQHD